MRKGPTFGDKIRSVCGAIICEHQKQEDGVVVWTAEERWRYDAACATVLRGLRDLGYLRLMKKRSLCSSYAEYTVLDLEAIERMSVSPPALSLYRWKVYLETRKQSLEPNVKSISELENLIIKSSLKSGAQFEFILKLVSRLVHCLRKINPSTHSPL